MAIVAVFQGNITQGQYEQVRDQVMPGNRAESGLLYHVAGQSENGWCVVEVWESQEAIHRFFDQKLGRALQEANINVQPQFFQVVNTIQP